MVNLVEIGVYEKSLDAQGRVVIPVALRARLKKFLLFVYKDHLKIVPKEPAKLSDFFDSVEVDSDSFDYKSLKKEALDKKYAIH